MIIADRGGSEESDLDVESVQKRGFGLRESNMIRFMRPLLLKMMSNEAARP